MLKKDFIDRLKFPHQIFDDKIDLWQELINKYPYSANIQQSYFLINNENKENAIKKIALFKNDPFLFLNLIKNKTEKINVKEVSEEIDVDKENVENIELENKDIDQQEIDSIEFEKEDLSINSSVNNDDILNEINVLTDENTIVENIKSNLEEHVTLKEENNFHLTSIDDDQDKSLMVMYSFTDWLQHFKNKNQAEIEEENDKKKLRVMLQRQKLDTAMDTDNDDVPEDIFKLAMDSISFGPSIISESLAEILAKQGKIDKAVEMFKKLSLLNPEKNAYFASKIKDLHLNN